MEVSTLNETKTKRPISDYYIVTASESSIPFCKFVILLFSSETSPTPGTRFCKDKFTFAIYPLTLVTTPLLAAVESMNQLENIVKSS